MYIVISSKSRKPLSEKIESKTAADVAAKAINESTGEPCYAIQIKEQKKVIRSQVVKADRTGAVRFMALARPVMKGENKGKQKVLRVGTLQEIQEFQQRMMKKNGYCPVSRRAHNAIVGQYV